MAKNKKRRKKHTVPEKIKHAQRINDLKRKLYQVFVAAGNEDVFKLIPPAGISKLLSIRIRPLNIEIDKDADLTPGIVDYIKNTSIQQVKEKRIKLCENGPEISLYDYLYAGEHVRYFIKHLKKDDFQNAEIVINAFKPFMKLVDEDLEFIIATHRVAETLAYAMSDIKHGIFTFKYDYFVEQKIPFVFYNRFLVSLHQPPMISIKLDNEKRKAFRLVWLNTCSKVNYAKVPLDKLGLNNQIKNLQADVYIQKHALERLCERLDCIIPQMISFFLMRSIMACNIAINAKGQQLIEFWIDTAKVGYLTFTYAEGVVVIRTFLLITNNGTPEGEKLHRLLGVEKLDKQYLGIDKLSAFAKSDIEKNPMLKATFEKAGCSGLFQIAHFAYDKNNSLIHNADKIADYLELSKTSTDLNENERAKHPAETCSISV